ncbi:hypothetical protein BDZ45DRAFT_672372 [Acephala macrosclerotiorum]|nr:hypothetical protein BDZ45DRAFT_672372 [Acephala macrosclerotiorum]
MSTAGRMIQKYPRDDFKTQILSTPHHLALLNCFRRLFVLSHSISKYYCPQLLSRKGKRGMIHVLPHDHFSGRHPLSTIQAFKPQPSRTSPPTLLFTTFDSGTSSNLTQSTPPPPHAPDHSVGSSSDLIHYPVFHALIGGSSSATQFRCSTT